MSINKVRKIEEAISEIEEGSRIMVGGFGLSGDPNELIDALADSGVGELTIISNDLGSPGEGLGQLLRNDQVKSLIGNYYTWNPEVGEAYKDGEIDVQLLPQGTFAEGIRAAGVGIPAFYTRTSYGTPLGEDKEVREFDGEKYVLEEAIHADVALIQAHIADKTGNLKFYKTARNFNPLMAMASELTIVEVDKVVEPGELDPECVHTPRIFTDMIVEKEVEK